MDRSQETLRRIEQNDAELKILRIGSHVRTNNDGAFNSSNSEDYSRLGAAIGNNTHLTKLVIHDNVDNGSALTVTNSEFFDGLKQNTSIRELYLDCNNDSIVEGEHQRNRIIIIIAGGVVHEIFKAYQDNSNHLARLCISGASLQNGGDDIIANTLRRCTNLKEIYLWTSNITDAQLLPIVDAIRGHNKLKKLDLGGNNIGDAGCETLATLLEDPSCNLRSLRLARNQIGAAGATAIANSLSKNVKLQLEKLDLSDNNIGDVGCEAIATLLEDPNCNLRSISLRRNQIGDGGATAIANSLLGNNKLQKLYLQGNSLINCNIFSGVLCNTSSINMTYLSNHTLIKVKPISGLGPQLVSLLKMNMGTNKSHVAMKKILKYHPNIDMKPMFEWDAEEGEQNLKALPYVIDWFDRAKVAVIANAESDDEGDGDNADSDDEEESYNIDGKKLSAIYQFAMAMPLLLVPASHVKADSKKRKMSDM